MAILFEDQLGLVGYPKEDNVDSLDPPEKKARNLKIQKPSQELTFETA